MRIYTESELRDKYKREPFISFTLPKECRLTPAAAQFLSERKIEIVQDNRLALDNSFKRQKRKILKKVRQPAKAGTHDSSQGLKSRFKKRSRHQIPRETGYSGSDCCFIHH